MLEKFDFQDQPGPRSPCLVPPAILRHVIVWDIQGGQIFRDEVDRAAFLTTRRVD